jgi:SAM-dependent methyltransferase
MNGTCNICGWTGEFLFPERGREGTQCANCASSSRNRAVVHALSLVVGAGLAPLCSWEPRKSFSLLESSARGSPAMMFHTAFNYYATEYDPEKIAAGTDPRAYADFQHLHYADTTFDAVIASDVFEHVRNDADGYREILRVLKEGGSLLLTVPYDHERETTIRRVDTSGTADVHLLEPEYHGGGGHTLTYRNYGRDLLILLAKTGFAVTRLVLDLPALGITPQSVFVGRKGAYAEMMFRERADTRSGATGVLFPFRAFLFYKYNLLGFVHYLRELRRS